MIAPFCSKTTHIYSIKLLDVLKRQDSLVIQSVPNKKILMIGLKTKKSSLKFLVRKLISSLGKTKPSDKMNNGFHLFLCAQDYSPTLVSDSEKTFWEKMTTGFLFFLMKIIPFLI